MQASQFIFHKRIRTKFAKVKNLQFLELEIKDGHRTLKFTGSLVNKLLEKQGKKWTTLVISNEKLGL